MAAASRVSWNLSLVGGHVSTGLRGKRRAPIPPVMSEVSASESLRLYSAAEVAEMLNVSKRTVERATSEGVLPHRALGAGSRSARYTRNDVAVYLESIQRVGRAAE